MGGRDGAGAAQGTIRSSRYACISSIAVASVSGQIAASSLSGTLSYWRKNAVDPKLASVLLGGSVMGTAESGTCNHCFMP